MSHLPASLCMKKADGRLQTASGCKSLGENIAYTLKTNRSAIQADKALVRLATNMIFRAS